MKLSVILKLPQRNGGPRTKILFPKMVPALMNINKVITDDLTLDESKAQLPPNPPHSQYIQLIRKS